MSFPVLGIDLSLLNAGLAALPLDVGGAVAKQISTMTFGIELDDDADERDRIYRLAEIADEILEFWRECGSPAVVALENYAFSRDSASVTKLAEIGGVVKFAFYRAGIFVQPVVASSARKLLTGYGGGTKEQAKRAVQAAVIAAGYVGLNEHEADAFAVANLLLSEMKGGIAVISPPISKKKGKRR